MRRLACACGQPVSVEDARCVRCGRQLFYDPVAGAIASPPLHGRRPCANNAYGACHWLAVPGEERCLACRHNRQIPALSIEGNLARWGRIERAKRHVFWSLLRWRLPTPTRAEHPEGLAFDFLDDAIGQVAPVVTGHAAGVITIALAEADEVARVERRVALREGYRTLVGHLRHELGHFYWDRLVRDAGCLAEARRLFGDERQPYADAIARHHASGPPADWQERHVSRYASSHPWEDFAETWAHVMHIVDGLDTAADHGLDIGDVTLPAEPYVVSSAHALFAAWVPLVIAVNALNRSMGQPDVYPFVLTQAVEAKAQFVLQRIHA